MNKKEIVIIVAAVIGTFVLSIFRGMIQTILPILFIVGWFSFAIYCLVDDRRKKRKVSLGHVISMILATIAMIILLVFAWFILFYPVPV